MASNWFFRTGVIDPLREMRRFQDELDRMFDAFGQGAARALAGAGSDYPPINVWANQEGAVITAELPGVAPGEVSISVHDNLLTLSGTVQVEPPAPGAVALRRERPQGRFSRTIPLPFGIDSARVEARAENGVLVIHLPRPESERPRRIPITSA